MSFECRQSPPQILKKRLAEETSASQRVVKEPNQEELEKKLKELRDKNRQLILDKGVLQSVIRERELESPIVDLRPPSPAPPPPDPLAARQSRVRSPGGDRATGRNVSNKKGTPKGRSPSGGSSLESAPRRRKRMKMNGGTVEIPVFVVNPSREKAKEGRGTRVLCFLIAVGLSVVCYQANAQGFLVDAHSYFERVWAGMTGAAEGLGEGDGRAGTW